MRSGVNVGSILPYFHEVMPEDEFSTNANKGDTGSQDNKEKHTEQETFREVNLILDPSALTLGLGNVERWFDREYLHSQVRRQNERIRLNLYLPTHTLHELKIQKRGPIVGSTKARQALKFIEHLLENDTTSFSELNVNDGPTVERKNEETSNEQILTYNLTVEFRTSSFPQWDNCVKYQMRQPSPSDFPKHVSHSYFEQINNFGDEPSRYSEDLSVPVRLRHLIRSCIYLTRLSDQSTHFASEADWKLVTEDATTRIWANCFGIDCLNINETELLLFQDKDVTKFEIKKEGSDFFSLHDAYENDAPNHLHIKVDTTSYDYVPLDGDKRKNSMQKTMEAGEKRGTKQSRKETNSAETQDPFKIRSGVITEDFNMINYAPRNSTTELVSSNLCKKQTKRGSKKKKYEGKTEHEKNQPATK